MSEKEFTMNADCSVVSMMDGNHNNEKESGSENKMNTTGKCDTISYHPYPPQAGQGKNEEKQDTRTNRAMNFPRRLHLLLDDSEITRMDKK